MCHPWKFVFLLLLFQFSFQNITWTSSHLTISVATTVFQISFISLPNYYNSLISYLTASTLSPTQEPEENLKSPSYHILLLIYLNSSHAFQYTQNEIKIPNTCLHHPALTYFSSLISYYVPSCTLQFIHSVLLTPPKYIKAYSYLNSLMLAVLFVWNKPLIFQ